jgi:hypothetical protein
MSLSLGSSRDGSRDYTAVAGLLLSFLIIEM